MGTRAALCLILLAAPFAPLAAETDTRIGRKVVDEIKVYSWDSGTRVWHEGPVIKKRIFYFSASGRLAREEITDGQGALLEKTDYAYEGTTVRKTVRDPQGNVIRRSRVERDGALETETVISPGGEILFTFVIELTTDGRIKEKRRFLESGELLFLHVFLYDERGLLSAVEVRNPDGSVAVRISYRYPRVDQNGSWRTREEYYSYGDVGLRPHEVVYRTEEEWTG
ncbi:MAG TPA: hypothetical protein ENN69_08555 [Spirochaetia bacterium]|nr:hypothetical protein [Spirochaetia bacterium]